MSKSDKAFCIILAIIIGGCVSNNAVNSWHDIKVKQIHAESLKNISDSASIEDKL